MDFKQMYQEKLVSAEKAASVIKSGDWVDYGWTTATPVAVDKAIAKRLPELTDVNFRGGILMWVPEIFKIDNPAEHMTWNSWHMGGIERKAIAQGFTENCSRNSNHCKYFSTNCFYKTIVLFHFFSPFF